MSVSFLYWARPLSLLVFVGAIYWSSLNGPFVFDDWHVIAENPSIRQLNNIPLFFVDQTHFSILSGNQGYRPIFLTSMALCWWAGGGAPLPFHLLSMVLHASNAFLLILICCVAFTKSSDPKGGLSSSSVEWGAWLSGALFALHPLATESINYASSQSVPLASAFFLISLYLFMAVYSGAESFSRRAKWVYLCVCYVSYGLALLSKPIAISLPVIVLLWEFLGHYVHESIQKAWKQWWKAHWKRFVPYVVISMAYLWVRSAVVLGPFGGPEFIRPIFDHYLTQTKALVFYYLKLSLLLGKQNVDVVYSISNSLFDLQVIAALVFLCGIIWTLVLFRHQRNVVFWSLWFPVCLFLTTYGVVLRQVVNEHRVYLSLAGLCALFGFLAVKGWEQLQSSGVVFGQRKVLSYAASFGVVIGLMGMAYHASARSNVWESRLTLWGDAARNGGTWRAHMNYGIQLRGMGRLQESAEWLERAVENGPYAFAHINLGLTYFELGETDEALGHLYSATMGWPMAPEPWFYLGYVQNKIGDYVRAELNYLRALKLRPRYLTALRELADFYAAQKLQEDERIVLQYILALDSTQLWARSRIGEFENFQSSLDSTASARLFTQALLLQHLGSSDLAIQRYERLLLHEPGHRQGTFNLAYAYMLQGGSGSLIKSAGLFKKVLEIEPLYVEALHHLATVLWKVGEKEEAIVYDMKYLEKGQHVDLRKLSKTRLQ